MSKSSSIQYSDRDVVILELPLPENARLLRPEKVVIRDGRRVHDIGVFCYLLRSSKPRKSNGGTAVVLDSFLKERVPQVRGLIRTLASLRTHGGLRARTLDGYCLSLKYFLDWADGNGHCHCLAGGEFTRDAYRGFAADVEDCYRRQVLGSAAASRRQLQVLTILEALTGLQDLSKGIRLLRTNTRETVGTEPVNQRDFAIAIALNEALFKGLSDLVLEHQPFPYRLRVPEALGYDQNQLWVFPSTQWFLAQHLQETPGERFKVYNYRQGCLASEEALWPHYSGKSEKEKRWWTRHTLAKAQRTLDAANSDSRSYYRLMLAHLAHDAFCFLFLANTGGNLQTVLDIETDGAFEEGAVNQGFRSIKWRADGKEVDLVVPVAFMPSLRRYLVLRQYLLNGNQCPHLFITCGQGYKQAPRKATKDLISGTYGVLRRISTSVPQINPRRIRATVSDYYQRQHDVAVTSAVLQNTEATALKSYNAGTSADQEVEISLFLQKIAQKAQTQVVSAAGVSKGARPLEDGGVCDSYGHPQALSEAAPLSPNCKSGCLFCSKRVLVAGEEDTRKIASAAFLMERLIQGPLTETEYRPHIDKCDEDLAKLRAFEGCLEMVDRVTKDVYENGNLTPYFADKYQLFLSLGVL